VQTPLVLSSTHENEVHAAKILAIPRATPQPRRRRYSSHERSTSHCAPAASSAIEPFRVEMSEAALDAERTQGMFCSTSNPVMRPGYLKGSSIWIARNVERKVGNSLGHKFWARGYFVSIVARNEQMIRAYIRTQEMADKQLDQLQLKLASS
jgi:putative transposase